jgi:predicted alpha/beta-fold hydrolase
MIADSLLSGVQRKYLDPHQRIFQDASPNIVRLYDDLRRAPSLTKFAYSHSQLFHLYKELDAKYTNDDQSMWTCYATYDTARYAKNIDIPLLAIIAEDDPIIKTSTANKEILLHNANITRLVTNGGSHCMFRDDLMKTNDTLNWAEGVVLGFFQSIEDNRVAVEQASLSQNRLC